MTKKDYAEVEVDLSKVDVHVDDEHRNKIMVDEEKKNRCIDEIPYNQFC